MANELRVRANFVAGALSASLTSSGTSMSSAALADLPDIGTTEHAAISLFIADSDGRITAKEIVHVTAHTASATTATIARGKEGTTGVAWASGDKWEHSATKADFAWAVRATTNTSQGSIVAETDLTGLTVTIAPGSGRIIRVSFVVPCQLSTASEASIISIKEGTTYLQEVVVWCPSVGSTHTSVGAVLLAPTDAVHTYKLVGDRTSGTLTMAASAARQAFILAEDIGTA